MKSLIAFISLLLAALTALGQTTIMPNTTALPKATVLPGSFGSGHGTLALVTTCGGSSGTGVTSQTCITPTTTIYNGDIIYCTWMVLTASKTITSLSDSPAASSWYVPSSGNLGPYDNGSLSTQMAWGVVNTSVLNAKDTITFGFASSSYARVACMVVSGYYGYNSGNISALLDNSSQNQLTSTGGSVIVPATGGTTPTGTNDLLLCGVSTSANSTQTPAGTDGQGHTLLTISADSTENSLWYYFESSSAAYSCSATLGTNADWNAQLGLFH